MPRIALATARESTDLHTDGPLLLPALAGVGLDVEVASWGGGTDWSGFDAVVVRTTWDYVFDREAFVAWAAGVAEVTRLANPVDVLAWNTDKRYLRDLQAAGIPIVPTLWVEPGDEVPEPPWEDFVVKPSVSAGAWLSGRYRRGDDLGDHVRRIHASGAAAMLQPYLPSVDADGETGTYVFGGATSHAIRKAGVLPPGQAPRDDLSGGETQRVGPVALDPRLVAFATRVLEAAPPLIYARVDTASGIGGEPLLLELEATEPFLFLEHAPGAADRFARAIARWLDSGIEAPAAAAGGGDS